LELVFSNAHFTATILIDPQTADRHLVDPPLSSQPTRVSPKIFPGVFFPIQTIGMQVILFTSLVVAIDPVLALSSAASILGSPPQFCDN